LFVDLTYTIYPKIFTEGKIMARIAGVDLPREKRIEVGIRSIYGIGPARSKQILGATGINPDTRVKDLTDDEVNLLRDYIDKNIKVEGDLRPSETEINVEALLDGVVDLPLEEIEGGDERLLAILAPFVYDTGGDVIDAERTLPYDASLVARVTGQVALADTEAQLAKRLGQLRLRYFFIHDLVV